MSLLSWTYEGSDEARKSDADGRQHARSGDAVYDDERGVGIIDKLDGAMALIEFGKSGERKTIVPRAARCVYVVICLGQHLAEKWC